MLCSGVEPCGQYHLPNAVVRSLDLNTLYTTPMSDETLPSGSPYLALPSDVLELLKRSYRERNDTNSNLFNGFDFDKPQGDGKKLGPNDRTLTQVLDAIGLANLEVVKRNYFIAASKLPGFWAQVRSIRETWGGSSEGFTFNCDDRGALERMLQGSSQFCADWDLFQSDHQKPVPTQCYRQLMARLGPGLHVCIVKFGYEDCAGGPHSIHIDHHQIATATMANGRCFYSYILDHMVDVGPHLIMDLIIPAVLKLLKANPIDWGSDTAKETFGRLLQAELGGIAALIRRVHGEELVNKVVNDVVDYISSWMILLTKSGVNPAPCNHR